MKLGTDRPFAIIYEKGYKKRWSPAAMEDLDQECKKQRDILISLKRQEERNIKDLAKAHELEANDIQRTGQKRGHEEERQCKNQGPCIFGHTVTSAEVWNANPFPSYWPLVPI